LFGDLDAMRDRFYLVGFREMDAAEFVTGGQAELFVAEARPGAGQNVLGARLAAASTVPEPRVADVEAEHGPAGPRVDPEQGVGERMGADVEAGGAQHGDGVHLADERIVGEADPPPDGLRHLRLRIPLPARVQPDLPGRVPERRDACRVVRAETGEFLKRGQAAEPFHREVHDVGEGKVRPPVDDRLDAGGDRLADAAKWMLTGHADRFDVAWLEFVEGFRVVREHGPRHLGPVRILLPSP
jgi:hypothetical protein